MKGLEEFNYVFPNECEYTCNEDIKYSKAVISIKNKLQVLDIIRRVYKPTEYQLNVLLKIEIITQEEYDLLKEVLK